MGDAADDIIFNAQLAEEQWQDEQAGRSGRRKKAPPRLRRVNRSTKLKPKPATLGSELADAVRGWIQAEAYFRLGPRAYGDSATRHYLAAEERLREALTGCACLRQAGESVGCILEDKSKK